MRRRKVYGGDARASPSRGVSTPSRCVSLHQSPGGRCIVARQEAKRDVFLNFWPLLAPHIDAWTSLLCSAAFLLWYNDQTYYFTRPSRGLKVDDAFSFDRSSTWSSTITRSLHRNYRFRRSRPAPARRDRKRRRKWNTQSLYNPTQAVPSPNAHFASREVDMAVFAFHMATHGATRQF